MRTLLTVALCFVAVVTANFAEFSDSLDESPENRGLIINLGNGELCFYSVQCKSSCCHRPSGISLARCAPRAAENETCSKKTLYGTYYYCPCEKGLRCEGDWSIGGSITNTNFGTCADPNTPK